MHHHGPGIRRVAGFDASQEGQDGSGILGHAVVRPGHELKLPQLSFLARAVLQKETMKFKRDVIGKEKKKKKNTYHAGLKNATTVKGQKRFDDVTRLSFEKHRRFNCHTFLAISSQRSRLESLSAEL